MSKCCASAWLSNQSEEMSNMTSPFSLKLYLIKSKLCGFKIYIYSHSKVLNLKQTFQNHELLSVLFTHPFSVCQQLLNSRTGNTATTYNGNILPWLTQTEQFLPLWDHLWKNLFSWVPCLIPEASFELLLPLKVWSWLLEPYLHVCPQS